MRGAELLDNLEVEDARVVVALEPVVERCTEAVDADRAVLPDVRRVCWFEERV